MIGEQRARAARSAANWRVGLHSHLSHRLALAVALIALIAPAVGCGGDGGVSPTPRRSKQATATLSHTPTAAVTATPSSGSSSKPTIYLLGGSSARECVVSNASWAAQIEKLGGVAVRAVDLGARNETFAQDIGLVGAMPKAPRIVLIGLTVGRYTGEPAAGGSEEPPADALAALSSGAEVRHQYALADVLSDGRKRKLVGRWVSDRYPVFQQNFAYNSSELERLIDECRARKVHPVLLELPLNLEIVGKSFDPARAKYRAAGRKLAARYDVPYVDFVADTALSNAEFYDLFHLVEPGRAKWQKRLSREVATLLEQYGMDGH